MSEFNTKYFASVRDENTVCVLHIDDGQPVTRIEPEEFNGNAPFYYDAVSGMGTGHEHVDGIVLANADAKLLNLEFVDYR